jgi:Sortilin, neurotensin receptor 3,
MALHWQVTKHCSRVLCTMMVCVLSAMLLCIDFKLYTGGTWKLLTPPLLDSNKQCYPCPSMVSQFPCVGASCFSHSCSAVHCIHGYAERWDLWATYSMPSVPGLKMAVGSVGKQLAPYMESDTFFSHDAGFTWEEVNKDAHLWKFSDSGSILVRPMTKNPVTKSCSILTRASAGMTTSMVRRCTCLVLIWCLLIQADSLSCLPPLENKRTWLLSTLTFHCSWRANVSKSVGMLILTADWLFKVFWMFIIWKRMTLSFGVPGGMEWKVPLWSPGIHTVCTSLNET